MTTHINPTGETPLYRQDYPHECVYLGRFHNQGEMVDLYISKDGATPITSYRYGNGRYDVVSEPSIEAKDWVNVPHSPIGECYRRAMAYL